MYDVLQIENASFDEPWTDSEFTKCLKKRNVIGVVLETDFKTSGFMLYELHKSSLRVVKFAVHPNERRNGYGRQMVGRLVDKLEQQRRTEIEIAIPEANLQAQLFFSACGFNAEEIRDGEYVFRYWVRNAAMKGDEVGTC
jgi:ribosomal-protein-alanine N-acetyltransferase